MKRIHLLGNLGEKFGPLWRANCSTVSEALRLIECQCPDFKKYLIDIVEQGTNFAVRTGEELLETGEELFMNVTEEDVYITEVPVGSGGWGKIIVGAILIVAAIAFVVITSGAGLSALSSAGAFASAFGQLTLGQAIFAVTLASIGLNLIMAGVNELLMPKPDKGKQGGAFFSGPINTVKQGQPVPVLYGELIVGGAPISVSYTKSKITTTGYVYTDAQAGPPPAGTTSTSNPYATDPQNYSENYIGNIDSLVNLDLIRESLSNFQFGISYW
jgi:predicted phage tail protein